MHTRFPLRLTLAAALLATLVLAGRTSTASRAPLKEVSYYPRNHAWLKFWEDWPDTVHEMDEDLDRIAGLGANTVRIFVHPAAFHYPAAPTPAQLGRLEEALATIAAHGLQAHVTLFDCWWSWPEIEASKAWMAGIVGAHQNDPRVAVWELQNEVDLSRPVVRDWVRALFPYLKRLAGDTPCTLSVLDVEWLDDVQALTAPTTPDLYSLHWYPPSPLTWTTTLSATLQRAVELVGADRLLLGEFGFHTCCFTEATQADLYRDVLYTARQQGIVHLGQWTLYDFPAGTAQCDPQTAASCAERHFGVYRLDGSPKPAAEVLRDAFHDHYPASPSPSLVRNESFEEGGANGCERANWRPWDEQWTGQPRYQRDCATAHSGRCSVRVSGSPTMTVGLYNVPALALEKGRQYSLAGYARADGLGESEAWLVFSCFDGDGNWIGNHGRSEPLRGTVRPWTRLRVEGVTFPEDAAFCQVFAQVGPAPPQAVVWFDDVTTLFERVRLPLMWR